MIRRYKGRFLGVMIFALIAFISPSSSALAAQSVSQLRAQIDALLDALQAPIAPAISSCAVPTVSLSLGSRSSEVKKLQVWLNTNGYPVAASGMGSSGNENDYFGELTRRALARFQSAAGIRPATGFYGPITISVLREYCGVQGNGLGLAIRLSDESPKSETVARGSARLPVLSFDVSGTSTLRSVTIHHYGEGRTTGFSKVYLYDGAVRLTSGYSINEVTGNVIFTDLNITVAGKKTLTVVADVSSSDSGNKDGFEIVSADAIKADGPIVGSFPVRGGLFTRLDLTVGTVTIAKSGALKSPTMGSAGAKVAQFTLTPGTREDAVLRSIMLKNGGSINPSLVSNFILKHKGVTLSTVSAINAKGQLLLPLLSPLPLEAGNPMMFELYADIASAARIGDTLRFYLETGVDIDAVGAVSKRGVRIISTAYNNSGQNGADASWVSIVGGALTIMFEGPSVVQYSSMQNDVELMRLNISARNNVEVHRTRFMITAGGSGINNDLLTVGGLCNLKAANYTDIKLVDAVTGEVLTRPFDTSCATGDQDANRSLIFTDYWTIGAGRSRMVKLTADIAQFIPADNETIKATLLAFEGDDIRNLDSWSYLTVGEILPAGNLVGATHRIHATAAAAISASTLALMGSAGATN